MTAQCLHGNVGYQNGTMLIFICKDMYFMLHLTLSSHAKKYICYTALQVILMAYLIKANE